VGTTYAVGSRGNSAATGGVGLWSRGGDAKTHTDINTCETWCAHHEAAREPGGQNARTKDSFCKKVVGGKINENNVGGWESVMRWPSERETVQAPFVGKGVHERRHSLRRRDCAALKGATCVRRIVP
jgi:hypothetical protein